MAEELGNITAIIVLGLIVWAVFYVPILLWRLLQGKKLIKKKKDYDSPSVYYIGLLLSGGLAIESFITGTPYFGLIFVLIFMVSILGLFSFKNNRRE